MPQSNDWQISPNADGTILEGVADVQQCITNIVLAQLGSNPFRPDFGIDILALLGQPANLVAGQRARVKAQIQKYEPRANVLSVGVTVSEEIVTFAVKWQYRATEQLTTVQRGNN